jgi:transposase-like protein
MNNIGYTLVSIRKRTVCSIHNLSQRQIALSQIDLFVDIRDKHDIDDAAVLVDGSASVQRACRKHSLDFKYERHGSRNSVERVFCEIKRRATSFSNCFSNAEAETADEWPRSFSSAWNQLI